MATIELQNIVKRYGDGYPAVNDVSIDIADGEFMILVGPSGCGKSTLLRMIVGLEDITEGDLLIDGERVNDRAPRDRDLAMVFQNYALYPHLSVYENIAFPLRLSKGRLGHDEVDTKVREASRLLELDEHLDRKPGQLSGGQRQRVAMGRAIVREARAFLFDEPLSNLDAKLRGQMRTEISRLQRELGVTTVYVTHDQTEALTLGDRVAVLRKGVLQQCASPRELYESPANLFVAGFIGSPPMNLMPAEVTEDSIRLPFATVPLDDRLRAAVEGHDLLIAGVRPEHVADAARADSRLRERGIAFSADVDVVEWLGNEQYVYLPFDAPDAVAQELATLEADLDGESSRTQVVVALDAESRVERGGTVELLLDASRMHLFVPKTGENLTRPRTETTAKNGAEDDAEDPSEDDATI